MAWPTGEPDFDERDRADAEEADGVEAQRRRWLARTPEEKEADEAWLVQLRARRAQHLKGSLGMDVTL